MTDRAEIVFGASEALEYYKKEWDRLWQTRASLQQRAVSLITVSGVLVTLAFGFTTAVAKGGGFTKFTSGERVVLAIALGFFGLSAALALWTQKPRATYLPAFSDVLGIPDSSGSAAEAPPPLKRFVDAINDEHAANNLTADWLTVAFLAQLIAVITLAVAVILVTD